jgi:hypothetical protein
VGDVANLPPLRGPFDLPGVLPDIEQPLWRLGYNRGC